MTTIQQCFWQYFSIDSITSECVERHRPMYQLPADRGNVRHELPASWKSIKCWHSADVQTTIEERLLNSTWWFQYVASFDDRTSLMFYDIYRGAYVNCWTGRYRVVQSEALSDDASGRHSCFTTSTAALRLLNCWTGRYRVVQSEALSDDASAHAHFFRQPNAWN